MNPIEIDSRERDRLTLAISPLFAIVDPTFFGTHLIIMSIARHHNDWLSLVPSSGPFLSIKVLNDAFPQGLDKHDSDHARRLRIAFAEWDGSVDRDDQGSIQTPSTSHQVSRSAAPHVIHRAWIKFILEETLGYEDIVAEGQAIPQTLKSDISEYGETLRPDWIVVDPNTGKPRLLVQVYPRSQSLTRPVRSSRWKASPDTRMMQLLHDTGIRLGIVTNGDHWMLVNAPKNETTGYASWYANLWLDEPDTLRAFRTLLGANRLFGVAENQTLEALLDASAADQQEVTDQLGRQVRKAVEVLIQAIDKADQEHDRRLLADIDEKRLYESALTVMMRLVFLFCAEERELLLLGDDLYDDNYAVSTLRERLLAAVGEHSEEILGLRYDAWSRLLSTFRAVHSGVEHDRLKLPAYGGGLFNPDRYPFLEGRKSGTSWKDTPAAPLPISNRTVLHLLNALQVLEVRLPGGGAPEARRLSFRSLDIEQIGHVYEGLLDHTAKRAVEPVLGLEGTRDKEPEIALSELERMAWGVDHATMTDDQKRSALQSPSPSFLKFLREATGRSESALVKALKKPIDPTLCSRFRTACQDSLLWKRVEPFAGLVRLDTLDYPVVVTEGGVYVTSGTDRRSTGTHYTPKSLTVPIVQYTLEPLVFIGPAEGKPKEEWRLRSAKELLDLKICDMACGSGAFLVQACRYMSERLLEAWEEAERNHPGVPGITPEGDASYGSPEERLIPASPEERQTYALRLVAQRCLYGVDKNPLAVEMAKLSLWLLTLAKDKPFEFLDHAIRCGDSLIGVTSVEQLEKFSLDGQGIGISLPNFLNMITKIIEISRHQRVRLEKIADDTIGNVEEKQRLFDLIRSDTKRLNYAADRLLAASWKPAKQAERSSLLRDALREVDDRIRDLDPNRLEDEGRVCREAVGCPQPFHWILEFPEVFLQRGGFDAFVENPPFLGGQKITGILGIEYRDYLIDHLAHGKRGSADLCAYFFLRAECLLREGGQCGLMATNTIAQGDTREVGLDQITANGCCLFRAVSSLPWPGSASLEVALVWMRRGVWGGPFVLDEKQKTCITPYLTSSASLSGNPHRLKANESMSFIGSFVLGMGFVLTPDEAQSLIKKDAQNRDVIFPYLTGEDLNSRIDQTASRWVINFFDWNIEKAMQYTDCFCIVEEKVKPERMRKKECSGEYALRKPLPQKWWIYAEKRPALYQAIAGLSRVLVTARVSPTGAAVFVSPDQVLHEKVVVFPTTSYSVFGVIQSSLHWIWVLQYTSTLGAITLNYSPSDCFETFPFPADLPALLDQIGDSYHAHRKLVMINRQEGLTKTYNRFHQLKETCDDIQMLRDLHIEMDNAVAAAYGWEDLDLGHGFHETKQGIRFTISEAARREVLSRLLKLNHERYVEEVRQGLHDKISRSGNVRSTRGRTKSVNDKDPSLFNMEG